MTRRMHVGRAVVLALALAACAEDATVPPPSQRSIDSGVDAARDAELSDAQPDDNDYAPCYGFDPRAVHVMGEELDRLAFGDVHDFAVVAPHAMLDAHCYNFETSEAPKLRPDGRLVYIASWWVRPRRDLQLWVPDDYDPLDHTRTRHADEVLPTPGCPQGSEGVTGFVLDPRDGAAYYGCHGDLPGERIYDQHGELFYEGGLWAVGRDGTLLVRGTFAPFAVTPRPSAEPVDVELPEDLELFETAAVRSTHNGFWIALRASQSAETWQVRAQLAFVSVAGRFELVGDYPDAPQEYVVSDAALDADGNLYEIRVAPGDEVRDIVVRRELGALQSQIVLSEASQPAGQLPLFLGDQSFLVSAP